MLPTNMREKVVNVLVIVLLCAFWAYFVHIFALGMKVVFLFCSFYNFFLLFFIIRRPLFPFFLFFRLYALSYFNIIQFLLVQTQQIEI